MAGTSSIDIMGSLEDVLGGIMGSKTDLNLSMNLPFSDQKRSMKDNQDLIDKMVKQQKITAAREQQKAEGVRAGIDKGLRSPFETRISGR